MHNAPSTLRYARTFLACKATTVQSLSNGHAQSKSGSIAQRIASSPKLLRNPHVKGQPLNNSAHVSPVCLHPPAAVAAAAAATAAWALSIECCSRAAGSAADAQCRISWCARIHSNRFAGTCSEINASLLTSYWCTNAGQRRCLPVGANSMAIAACPLVHVSSQTKQACRLDH